jgi:hypothetical protein
VLAHNPHTDPFCFQITPHNRTRTDKNPSETSSFFGQEERAGSNTKTRTTVKKDCSWLSFFFASSSLHGTAIQHSLFGEEVGDDTVHYTSFISCLLISFLRCLCLYVEEYNKTSHKHVLFINLRVLAYTLFKIILTIFRLVVSTQLDQLVTGNNKNACYGNCLNVFEAKVGLLKAVNIIFVAAFALKRFHDRILEINIILKEG